jgi:MFS family permease
MAPGTAGVTRLCYRLPRQKRARRLRDRERGRISNVEELAFGSREARSERASLQPARWATSVYFLLLGFTFGSWVARIPAVQNRLGLDEGQLGIALLSLSAGAVVAMPATGWLIHRWGNGPVMRAAATIICASLPLLPLAPSMPLLMAALFLFGTGFGLLDVAMNTQAVAVEERYGRPIMSAFHGVFSVGGLTGSASAGVIAGFGIPPFPHLLAVALVLFILAAATSRSLLPGTARDEGAPAFALPPRSLLGLGLLCFCALLAEGAIADWSAVYLENDLGSTAAVAAAGYAAFSLAMAGMRFGGDALTLRAGPSRMVFIGGLISGLGLGAALLVGTIPATIAGFACVGIGLAVIFPIAMGAAGRTPGVAAGSAIAAVTTAGYTGFLTGPPLIGFIADSAGLRVGLALVALLFIVVALLAGTVRR